jgi:hypothetical protein
MPNVTLSIAVLLVKKNRLALLGGLINSDSFFSALSLAPGASAVAKSVAGLADKVLQTFLPAEESKPILEFSGDFNIATATLQDCYYAILGVWETPTTVAASACVSPWMPTSSKTSRSSSGRPSITSRIRRASGLKPDVDQPQCLLR